MSTLYREVARNLPILYETLMQGAGIGLIGYSLYKLNKNRKQIFLKKLHQTIEDRSCSAQILGVQGSGKTYLAMYLFLKDIKKGYGSLWLSTQGIDNSDLLNYIPQDKCDKVILLRPYSDRLRGINLLRQYTNSKQERMLIADSVVMLFQRLFENVGDNMKSILTASTLALLEYGDITKETVCLWDLYEFLNDIKFQNQVIKKIENRIAIDMTKELANREIQTSISAVLRRFRKMLYSDNLIAFLNQKEDDVDLFNAVKKKKIIICDFLSGGVGSEGLGKDNSKFLAELIVTKFQLIAETRNIHSTLYPLYLDEFPTYTSTADNVKDFIDLNRQRRMPVTLIHQRRDQLSKSLQQACDNCGTKYILMVKTDADRNHYKKMYEKHNIEIPTKKRECIFDILSYGRNYVRKGYTKNIGNKVGMKNYIEENNLGKYTVEEMVENIQNDNIQRKNGTEVEFE